MATSTITALTAFPGNPDRTADVLEIVAVSGNSSYKTTVNTLLGGITGAPVGTSDSQTLSNKTIGNTNAITVKDGSFTLQNTSDTTKQVVFTLASITTGTTRTITVPDASFTIVGTATTQTLTNKTITSPTITGGSIDNATVTVDTISGHSSATVVTVANLQISNGVLNTNNSVVTNNITDGAVTSRKLASGSLILAYVEGLTSGQNTSSTSYVDATGMTTTFTTPVGCTGIVLRAEGPYSCDTADTNCSFAITDGSNSVQVERIFFSSAANNALIGTYTLSRKVTVTANTSYTYKLRFHADSPATVIINQGNVANRMSILWVEFA